MPGPPPKPAALRQRRNGNNLGAHLPSESETAANDVPPLFDRNDEQPWHPKVVDWWESIWTSPMSAEYLAADMKGGLYLLADLHQMRWTATTRTGLLEAAKEIRLQEVRFGLSPIDRSRLRWEVARGEEAERKTKKARAPKKKKPKPGDDPRNALRVVS